MSSPLEPSRVDEILRLDAQQRYQYLVKEVVTNQEVWILTDQHGCMMLTTEDEDCIPVWPNSEFAEAWISGEWQHCKAEAIPLARWHSHWTPGMLDDELSLVIFPNQDEDGLVLFPDELDHELKARAKKVKQRR
ncbi:DUF2750 domain-containing protein [Dongshaea marina]|uniref:DUF2750 domain-containing protein n=1 Tax=Dongshaea marina TaxID=2047966 RepID=UPI000D3E8C52|nr:DUF2750 domain-containing protein [Dongshaea marina]